MLTQAADMSFNPRYHHTTAQLQDEQLIIEAAKLNPELFGPIYDKYYKQIFGYVYQRMDCKETAFDITAQVFLKALTNLPRYEFKGVPFASWLFRIAHSEVMQLFRDQKNKRAINADIGDMRNICDEVSEPFFEEYLPYVQKLIQQLPEDDLQMVEMRFFEQRPFKEIAEILNITENNAKVRMYRILERLKKSITNIKL